MKMVFAQFARRVLDDLIAKLVLVIARPAHRVPVYVMPVLNLTCCLMPVAILCALMLTMQMTPFVLLVIASVLHAKGFPSTVPLATHIVKLTRPQ